MTQPPLPPLSPPRAPAPTERVLDEDSVDEVLDRTPEAEPPEAPTGRVEPRPLRESPETPETPEDLEGQPLPPIPAADNLVAAVDLGSNSFHMVVARVTDDGRAFSVVDRIRENVRLGAGIDPLGRLTPEVQDRALATLRVFGQRLAHLEPHQVRAVGTNTLRQAQNAEPFLRRARAALGHKIDLISGREEARLIYRGVSHDLHLPGRRLVVDIGGGSTELIIGEGEHPVDLESRQMGCVSWSMRFFPEGKITRKAREEAVVAARLELQACKRRLRGLGWDHAVGSSGTINAIDRIIVANGLGPCISREAIDGLWRRLIDARRMDRVQLADLPEKRRSVLPGGLAVLEAVFSALKVERMSAAAGALREGVMLDLLGARRHEDVRALTVDSLEERFGVDRAQAARVAETALIFFDAVARPWGLSPRHRGLLGWAARLHEVGVFLNHSSYHRHGAYVLKHADLPGFARQDQEALSALVLCQRGNATEARVREAYSGDAQSMARLVALLRLSLRLHRSRSEAPLGTVGLSVRDNIMLLAVPHTYLRAHPLTRAELQAEADQLPALGLTLTVAEV